MSRSAAYDATFYSDEAKVRGPTTSAVVGPLNRLVHPRSVVDVGCGVGAFLREFLDLGSSDVLGLEGAWVGSAALAVEASQIHDLTSPVRLVRELARYEDVISCFSSDRPVTGIETPVRMIPGRFVDLPPFLSAHNPLPTPATF